MMAKSIDGVCEKPFMRYPRDKSSWGFGIASGGLLLVLFLLSAVDSGVKTGKQILGIATSGIESLETGNLELARLNFESARNVLSESNEALLAIARGLPGGADIRDLLSASELVAGALQQLQLGLEEFQNTKIAWNPQTNSSGQEFYQHLKSSRLGLVEAEEKLAQASALLSSVSLAIFPEDAKEQFLESRSELEDGRAGLRQTLDLQTFLLQLVGGERKTYLLIFQNNNEARATGGFIGTYGMVHFENGRVRIERIESIYNIDGQLKEKIAAPGPLQRQATKLWGMRDSNWFVDFPVSARKILSFLELESGILADGIISFTPDAYEQILAVTGPVEMPDYGRTLTAENFRETVQYETSLNYDKVLNQPKKFLSDFVPVFLDKLSALPREKTLDLANTLLDLAAQKHLLAFALDPDLEKNILDLQAGGEIKKTAGDYLAIYHSNVGGGKTDISIAQKVEKKASVISDGLAIVRLRITRTHNGFGEKFFPKNVDFMRVIVPFGSKLLSAAGFDDFALPLSKTPGAQTDTDLASWDQAFARDEDNRMYVGSESGYTVFANWLELEPGQSKTVELTYEVRTSQQSAYTHLLQKQPGTAPFDFHFEINYLAGTPFYRYPETFSAEGNKFQLEETVNSDRFYAVAGEGR